MEGAQERLLRGGEVKQIYDLKGQGPSARAIARELGIARNTVLRYLKSPEAIRPQPRPLRGSKLDPYTDHIDHGSPRVWRTAGCCRERSGSWVMRVDTRRWPITCVRGGRPVSRRRR